MCDSCQTQTHHSQKSNIYVIDNSSNDKSIDLIKKNFKKIKIIVLKKNYGYSKGYNIGLKKINDEILCLINNDVKITQNWLNPILDFYNKIILL